MYMGEKERNGGVETGCDGVGAVRSSRRSHRDKVGEELFAGFDTEEKL